MKHEHSFSYMVMIFILCLLGVTFVYSTVGELACLVAGGVLISVDIVLLAFCAYRGYDLRKRSLLKNLIIAIIVMGCLLIFLAFP